MSAPRSPYGVPSTTRASSAPVRTTTPRPSSPSSAAIASSMAEARAASLFLDDRKTAFPLWR